MEGYIGIFDPDRMYLGCLLKGLMDRCPQGIQLVEFTKLESVTDFARGKNLVLLVISDMAVNDEILRAFEGRMVLLKEEQDGDYAGSVTGIFKYQPLSSLANGIFEQLFRCTSTESAVSLYKPPVRGTVLGIYSPLGRCLKTSFAIAAAQILGEHKRTLLLSFEEYSALGMMLDLGDYGDKDMSDAIYFFLHGTLAANMASVVRSCHSFDIIMPAKNPQDLREISDRDLGDFINCFADIYGCVVVDFGNCVSHINRKLCVCKRIFMPVRTDWISEAKVERYLEYVRGTEPSLINLIEEVRPPYQHIGSGPGKKDGGNFQRLVSGEFYDYVRQCL